MLWVSTDLTYFSRFRDIFKEKHNDKDFLDISKLPSSQLAEESLSIVGHHTNVAVFLGYLEPGWMMDLTHQTILRKLIRKFPVAMVCHYSESIPFSWKNEISILYTCQALNKNGLSGSLNDGCSLQHESGV